MKKIALILIALPFLFTACKKNDPDPVVDQEEVSGLTFSFTEVKGTVQNGVYTYTEIADPEVESVSFSGTSLLPPVGAHVHLEVGNSYRFNVKIKDFAGRETQQSFVDRDDIHFAFLLGVPAESLHVQYDDIKTDGSAVKVGLTGHVTVLKESPTFVLNYIIRHLNPGIKKIIDPKKDWSNVDFQKFTGSTDVSIKFDLHLVTEDEHEGH